ncbi:hypothetical protein EIP91_007839 [Steccherinum ochraceum]|uniref:Eisosome component PIL1-domain-containing protein n=1 Tax=Steccherinum ochraceum TaxID=92696 RepID=A0A4R0RBX1_9APHY|nr:hypothetical protein EIP91_007839 [Steccherinum ochraceum]
MFKSVATKLAHNTTVPSLGGNKDLRGLQDMITAEKTVLSSSQKFALDLAKSAEALKHWGGGEGDDLGDISTAATTLMLHLAGAINHFSNIESTIREQMKAVRTREEALDEMRRRRRTLSSRADDAERKLSKMSPENKNLQSQTATLTQLRDDIRLLDADIMNEEAGLSDFKRQSMRSWLGHKFGGIQDFCEKGLIVSDLGKQLMNVIPMEQTQPGLPRGYYMGHAHTEAIVSEAQVAVQEVTFSAEPGTGRRAGGPGTQSFQSAPGGYGVQDQSTGPYGGIVQDQSLSGHFPAPPNSTFPGQIMTQGDKPGETLMRAGSMSQSSMLHSQAGSLPTSPHSYAPPQGPPPAQGYGSPAQQFSSYSKRSSFAGLPQVSQQQAGADLGMAAYLSPTQQDTPLPSVPEHQQQQSPFPPQPPSSYAQSQSPYQSGQNPAQQPQYPEPQTYPPQSPNHPQQPMPQGNYSSLTYPQQSPSAQPQGEVNEFGTYATPSGVYPARSTSMRHARQGADGVASPVDTSSSGRFATFPVKTAGPRPRPDTASPAPSTGSALGPTAEERSPSLDYGRQDSVSFSSSIAAALGDQWHLDRNSSVPGQNQGQPPQVPPGQQYQQAYQDSQVQQPHHDPRQSQLQDPRQAYYQDAHQSYYQDPSQPSPYPQTSTPQTQPQQPPQQQPHHIAEQSEVATAGHEPGQNAPAAIPTGPPAYDDAVSAVSSDRQSAHGNEQGSDSTALAYISDPEHGDAVGSEGSHGDKVVRFGSVRDVDQEMAKRRSHASEHQQQAEQPPPSEAAERPVSHEIPPVSGDVPQNTVSSPPVVTPHRAPTPSEEGHTHEASLNAAAAREVSRELDSLMFNSQSPQIPPAQPAQDIRSSSPPQSAPQPSHQSSYQPSYAMHRAQSPPTSPTSSTREPQYVREKDRSSGYPSRQPTPGSPVAETQAGGQSPLVPPPAISTSAVGSTASFRTPPEYPAAASPGSFYGLGQPATGSSTSFIPGANPRTISAAAFKRQVRQASNPANLSMDSTAGGGGTPDATSPLHVRKRVPGSPLPGDSQQQQRIPSAPMGGRNLPDPYADAQQYRSASATYAQPQSQDHLGGGYYDHQRQSQVSEDGYDYLSAYMTNDEDTHGGGLR